jgi:hypothetical protein
MPEFLRMDWKMEGLPMQDPEVAREVSLFMPSKLPCTQLFFSCPQYILLLEASTHNMLSRFG